MITFKQAKETSDIMRRSMEETFLEKFEKDLDNNIILRMKDLEKGLEVSLGYVPREYLESIWKVFEKYEDFRFSYSKGFMGMYQIYGKIKDEKLPKHTTLE